MSLGSGCGREQNAWEYLLSQTIRWVINTRADPLTPAMRVSPSESGLKFRHACFPSPQRHGLFKLEHETP